MNDMRFNYSGKDIYDTEVADLAGMTRTPMENSEGMNFLQYCFESAIDLLEETMRDSELNQNFELRFDELSNEYADGCVPIYTAQLWSVWTDCGGYNFDGSYRDFVSSSEQGTIMNRIAQADCFEWAKNIMYGVKTWSERGE